MSSAPCYTRVLSVSFNKNPVQADYDWSSDSIGGCHSNGGCRGGHGGNAMTHGGTERSLQHNALSLSRQSHEVAREDAEGPFDLRRDLLERGDISSRKQEASFMVDELEKASSKSCCDDPLSW